MATQCAYKGDIKLAFDYKASVNSSTIREEINPERIRFLMIENVYENINILPVVYISITLSNDMYTKVVDSNETSKFYIRVRKRNALSSNSVYKTVFEDVFTYVVSSTNPDYSDNLSNNSIDTYKGVMIGLVSVEMTNLLRKTYNGIYQNINQTSLIKMATDGLSKLVMSPIKYNKLYDQFVLPPITSRYRLLSYLFEQDPFYDSMFTFFMDFNKTYLLPKNGESVDAKDGTPNNIIVNVKDYTASEAIKDGYTIENGAYVVYVNGTNTNMIINNSISKVTNNIVGYYDTYEDTQNLNIDNNNTADNTTKTTFVRSNNAAGYRNEIESNSVVLELLKQNLDGEIFEPNKSYSVSNYGDFAKYNGSYYLAYKREFYYITTNGEFIISTNVGLKKAADEEVARSTTNELKRTTLATTSTGTTKTTSSKKTSLKSKSASRTAKATGYTK